MKNKNGQSVLETALIFVLIFLLVGGIIRIWIWSNNQIVARQLRYNATRVVAGSRNPDIPYQAPIWPVYTPGDLTEERVLIEQQD